MPRRVIILGGPRVGKTTLSGRLQNEFGISTLHTSQELEQLFPANQSTGENWSKSSDFAANWFDADGDWICEGVQMARALRKWLRANPGKPLDADVFLLRQPFVPLLPGQDRMRKGVLTVFQEIEPELIRRGARIQKLKDPKDAIRILGGELMPDEPGQGADPTQAFQNRLNKLNGDAMAFATQLFDENYRLREDKRTLAGQVEELKAKIPADGSLVLSKEEAAAFDAYKALGNHDEIKPRLEGFLGLEEENKKLKRRDMLRDVADVGIAGTKLRFSVLEDRVNASNGIEFVIKEEGRDKRRTAYVKDGDKETPLEQYAQKHWADYMPSLKAEPARRQPGSVNGGDGNNQPPKFDMNTAIRRSAGYPT